MGEEHGEVVFTAGVYEGEEREKEDQREIARLRREVLGLIESGQLGKAMGVSLPMVLVTSLVQNLLWIVKN